MEEQDKKLAYGGTGGTEEFYSARSLGTETHWSRDDIEEEILRDIALNEIPSRKRQQTSCRRARFLASNLLQALEASVVHNLT